MPLHRISRLPHPRRLIWPGGDGSPPAAADPVITLKWSANARGWSGTNNWFGDITFVSPAVTANTLCVCLIGWRRSAGPRDLSNVRLQEKTTGTPSYPMTEVAVYNAGDANENVAIWAVEVPAGIDTNTYEVRGDFNGTGGSSSALNSKVFQVDGVVLPAEDTGSAFVNGPGTAAPSVSLTNKAALFSVGQTSIGDTVDSMGGLLSNNDIQAVGQGSRYDTMTGFGWGVETGVGNHSENYTVSAFEFICTVMAAFQTPAA